MLSLPSDKMLGGSREPGNEIRIIYEELAMGFEDLAFFPSQAGDSRKVQTSHAPGGVSTKLPATNAGTHTGSGRNTYNDILETLKLLEAAPAPFDPGKTRDGGRGSADPTSPGYLSARNLQRLDGSVEKPSGGGKLQSILSYLDEMERAEEELVSRLSRPRSGLKTSGLPSPGAATSQPLQHTE